MIHRQREYEKPPISVDDGAYQDRVFGPVRLERQRILRSLIDEQSIETWRIANRMATCCRKPMVLRDAANEEVRLSEKRCRSRCCPRCRRFRAREVQHRLIAACKLMDSTRFLTLTLVSTDAPLRDQLLELRRSFARLRRDRVWRTRVVGGIYCVEVTWSQELRMWHPHLHAVIDGAYFPKRAIVETWKKASRGSYIVDIQYVHSASRIASYIAKYVSKGDDASKVPDYKLAEWAVSVHGLRLVHSFGSLHGVQLVEKPERSPGVSIEVVNPNELARCNHAGDIVAGRLLALLDAHACGIGKVEVSEILERIELWKTGRRLIEAEAIRNAPTPPRGPPATLF